MGFRFSWNRLKKAIAPDHPWCAVVVPAAGCGARMEGTDKLKFELAGKPVLAHTLIALQECPLVDEIIVVTREDQIVEVSELARTWNCTKVTKVVRGGETRSESVSLGLEKVEAKAELIGIHDGARPLVSQQVLAEVFAKAAKTGAAAPAVAVKDTIKEVDEHDLVTRTADRSVLRAVQTPQVFEAALIKAAMQKAMDEQLPLTDDCSAVEALGMKVTLTEGSYENIKITTPIDLTLAEAILACRAD